MMNLQKPNKTKKKVVENIKKKFGTQFPTKRK